MNIDEAVEILECYKQYLKEYKDNTRIIRAIETLLTAYEKEKEKNKNLSILRLELLISQFPDTTVSYKKYKKELDEILKEE